jgi:hypothetical protein
MRPDSRSRRRGLVLAPGRARASNVWPRGGGQKDLPVDDNAATLSDYADVVVDCDRRETWSWSRSRTAAMWGRSSGIEYRLG